MTTATHLQSFDNLLGPKMDPDAKNFWWTLISPVRCSCGQSIERDQSCFGIDKSKSHPRLFARCTCGKAVVFGLTST